MKVAEDINKQLNMQKSINQIVDILELLEDNGKIPQNVKEFFMNYYDENVEYKKIEPNIPLREQETEEYTDAILTHLTNKYLK